MLERLPTLQALPVIISALDWTTSAVGDFGARSFPSKPIVAMSHGMVAHRDGKVS